MIKNKIEFLRKKAPLSMLIISIYGGLLNSCVYQEHKTSSVLDTPFVVDKPSIDVCFSPEGNCLPIVLNFINNAKAEILVQSYSFTSKNIANALMRAHQRGVNVKILFNRSQLTARYSQIHKLRKAGIECIIGPVPGIAHNKIMIIDKDIVLTGSYNWTNAAETRNAENLLLIKNRPTAEIYERKWKMRYQKAKERRLQTVTSKINS